MRVDQFDFDLPEELIALRPAEPRDSARLLEIGPAEGALTDRRIADLLDLLGPDDLLIVNDTRVVPARLWGHRARGEAEARVEVMLHQRLDGARWRAFLRPAKKVNPGEALRFGDELEATLTEKAEGGEGELAFSLSGAALDAAIARVGETPLPPYIARKRAVDARDVADYQTVFAAEPGAVAAPTAGLHFTPALLAALAANGVRRESVTLHVGAGTFLPVTAETTEEHRMHGEIGTVGGHVADAITDTRARGGRVVAVGTTALRVLEQAATETGEVRAWSGETRLFIKPGYRFNAVDVLLTNFHLPRSTLFMLVSALRSLAEMKRAYAHAVAERYRFYSYGDACLIHRREGSAS